MKLFQSVLNLVFAGAILYLAWSQSRVDAGIQEQINACVHTLQNVEALDASQTACLKKLQRIVNQ